MTQYQSARGDGNTSRLIRNAIIFALQGKRARAVFVNEKLAESGLRRTVAVCQSLGVPYKRMRSVLLVGVGSILFCGSRSHVAVCEHDGPTLHDGEEI